MCATERSGTRDQSSLLHVCRKNQVTGSSKAMEPDAGVEMMVDAITKYNVIYSKIICDDDSTVRAVAK